MTPEQITDIIVNVIGGILLVVILSICGYTVRRLRKFWLNRDAEKRMLKAFEDAYRDSLFDQPILNNRLDDGNEEIYLDLDEDRDRGHKTDRNKQ